MIDQHFDFEAHNAEVKRVWEAYRAGRPYRVPTVVALNARYTLLDRELNPEGIQFEQYCNGPEVMLDVQLRHQHWVRTNIIQDREMGVPAAWEIWVDCQNTTEAAWFGAPIVFDDWQVPDTKAILDDDHKRLLFDRGVPDLFTGRFMEWSWRTFNHIQGIKAKGFTYKGKPLGEIYAPGGGTDGPLTVACNLRGASEFFMDLLDDQSYALELLSFITDATIARIKAYREHFNQPERSRGWWFADDSVQLLSAGMYQELIYPLHKRLIDALSDGSGNSIHLCGDSTRHFPFMKEKLNIVSFDTGFPVDFKWLREAVGEEVEIQGGPSVPFLQSASPSQIREEVRRICASGIMRGGKFVLREGNNLPPGIGPEKVAAMYEAGKEFGLYN